MSESVLTACLRDSVEHGFLGFGLVYQPIVYSETGELYGCEALLRWEHPDFPDNLSIQTVIHALENSGLIKEVGMWVIRTAFLQCYEWLPSFPSFQMGVNVSSSQFEDPDFPRMVMEVLSEYHLEPSLITLELTESREIQDISQVSQAFNYLRSQGIKIAFDDFGTGYDSLNIFRILSVDELKLDRSFLERLTYNITDQKLVQHIIGLCHSISMYVCVEGIESYDSAQIIRQLGASLCQGYYFNHPLTKEEFQAAYFSGPPKASRLRSQSGSGSGAGAEPGLRQGKAGTDPGSRGSHRRCSRRYLSGRNGF